MPPTNNPWLYLAGLVVMLLTGVGLKDIVLGLLKRRPRQAIEATNQIQLAKAAEEFAASARKSAQEAWASVDEAQRKLVRANRRLDNAVWQLEQAGRYLDGLMAKIFERGATIDEVRDWVRREPPPAHTRNGSGPASDG